MTGAESQARGFMRRWHALIEAAVELLYPRGAWCPGCHGPIDGPEGWLCDQCQEELDAALVMPPVCPRCGRPVAGEGAPCTECAPWPGGLIAATCAVFMYAAPMDNIVRALKYRGVHAMVPWLGGMMAHSLDDFLSGADAQGSGRMSTPGEVWLTGHAPCPEPIHDSRGESRSSHAPFSDRAPSPTGVLHPAHPLRPEPIHDPRGASRSSHAPFPDHAHSPTGMPHPAHPPRPDMLIPVPMHPGKQRRRGYNQAELLAREVGLRLHIPVTAALKRTRRTRAQAGLSGDERASNLRGAFRPLIDLHGRHVMLVDDVLTTGSTALECARVLLAAGAQSVTLAVLAATVPREY